MGTYEVKLEVFEGPIDLLLHLITRQRVDIYDVSLATITEEYLAAVRAMEALDLEGATGFLVVAATLLELKSARLLPSQRDGYEGALLEERDLLLARLVECATYREAGAWISTALARGADFHPRVAGPDPELALVAPDILASTTPADIALAGARALVAPEPEVLDVSYVPAIRASVRDAIAEIAARLAEAGGAAFTDLCGPSAARMDVIVHFLALLELFKVGAVDIDQHDRWGDITVRWTGEGNVEEVLAEAEEYTGARER